jgi:hypothetical protein
MVPTQPTAHTSFGALPQTPSRMLLVALANGVHSCPSQCWAVPPAPTAHMSFGALPQTAQRFWVVPLEGAAHSLPSRCWIRPPCPTAHTSSVALPQTPERLIDTYGVPVTHADQALPSPWRIVPP